MSASGSWAGGSGSFNKRAGSGLDQFDSRPAASAASPGVADSAADSVASFPGSGAGGGAVRLEVERLRQELRIQRQDAERRIADLELARSKADAQAAQLKARCESLQQSLDALTAARNKDSRDRTDGARQVEELRAENVRLRRELATALDTRLSHLRTPMVSFEQYRALLATAEAMAAALRDGGQLTLDGSTDPIAAARAWADSQQHGQQVQPTLQPQHGRNATSADVPSLRLDAATPMAAGAGEPAMLRAPSGADGGAPGHSRGASSVVLPPGAQPFMNPQRDGTSQPSVQSGMTPREQAFGPSPRSARESFSQQAQRQQERQAVQQHQQDAAVRESLVDGGKLVKIIRDASPHNGKQWAFENCTSDLQFVLDFVFGPQSEVVPIGDTIVEGRSFRVSVYPGETKEFVRGVINGYRMAIKYGPPDSGYVPSSSVTDAQLMPLVERVRALGTATVEDAARECVAQGIAFVDVSFPPLSKSMAKASQGVGPVVHWERPAAIVPAGEKPEVAVSGFDAGGPTRGTLNDPWLASAMAVLAPRRTEILRVFNASTQADQLAGLHRCCLCLGGWWVTIAIDSFIPCLPKSSTPFGTRCRSARDVWAPLLEKAMAKAYGSYLTLQAGDPLEGIADITGAATERIDWRAKDGAAFGTLLRQHRRNLCVLMTAPEPTAASSGSGANAAASPSPASPSGPGGASQTWGPATPGETTTDASRVSVIGFKPGHAYRVLAVVHCEDFRLCFISNPEGAGDWSGAWSAKSELWVRHPNVRQACTEAERQVPVSVAGGVWIEWRDVAFNFGGAGVAYLRPDWLDVRITNHFAGVKPQWMLELSVTKPTTIIVGVHQKDRRALPPNDPERSYSAFLVTCVACSDAGVWDAVAQSHGGTFWRGRDVHLELTLQPRDRAYYVIPRRYSEDRAKDVTVSLHIEDRSAVVAALKQPTDEVMNSVRYSPVWRFDPLPCPPVYPTPDIQIDRQPATSLDWGTH